MNHVSPSMPYTRWLAALLVANFAALVVLNLFRLPTIQTVPVYGLSLVWAWVALRRVRWRRSAPMPDKLPWLMAGAAMVLLTAPRIPYLLEWLPGVYVKPAFDDFARVAELVSMTLSPGYPLHHPENETLLFSFYYAPLYPMAALKLAVPVLTLKDTIVVVNALYHVLVLGSLVEVARLLLRDRRKVRVFLALALLFGGFDYLAHGRLLPPGIPEWWQAGPIFHGNTQISSFYIGLFCVIHHFVGFYAVVIAYVVFFYGRIESNPERLPSGRARRFLRWRKPALVLLLLCSAFYSSVFAFMSVPLFALVHRRAIWRKLILSPVFPAVGCAACVPLFLYLGKFPGQTLVASTFRLRLTDSFLLDKALSLPVFVLLVPLVEFGGIPLLILLVYRRLSPIARRYFAAAAVFFLLTYFLAYSKNNNLSMRGMFLPTFTFFLLFARYHGEIGDWFHRHVPSGRRAWQTAVALLFFGGGFGALYGATAMGLWSAATCSLSYRGLGLAPPEWVGVLERVDSRRIARDRRVTRLPASLVPAEQRRVLFGAEALLVSVPPSEMVPWERELARQPRRGFFR